MFSRILGPALAAGLLVAVVLVEPPRDAAAVVQPAAGASSADLAMVPPDSVGFVHVRLADLWKNEMFAGLRKTWERAGDKVLGAIDTQFAPAPSSLDRATAFVLMDDPMKEPAVFGILAFSKAFDSAQVLKSYLPEAKKSMAGNRPVFTDADKGIEIAFPDDRHILIGQAGTLAGYFARKSPADGPMSRALKLAESRPVVAAANIAGLPIPPGAIEQIPAEVRPLLKAEQVMIALDLGAEPRLEVRAGYKDAAAAGDAETAVKALVEIGRKELAKARTEMEAKLLDPNIKTPRPAGDLPEAIGTAFALGALGRVDDVLSDPKLIVRDGKDLAFAASMPKELVAAGGGFAAIGLGLALPAIQKVRFAAARSQSMNNLKQIGLAIHNYESANGHLPADILDKNGKAILSWRVVILPYIEQDNLYRRMKLDEPWNSENNAPLSKAIIKTYLSPNSTQTTDKDGYGLTNYLAASGKGAAFEPGKKLKIADFTDGLSNTIFAVDSSDMTPWAKPGDLALDFTKALPKFESAGKLGTANVLMGDGSVRTVNVKTITEKTLKAAFTRDGGEVLGADW
jgi:prepilin-type processing-associated H-X9-DG protein